jgi:hypothetical protein
MHEQRRAANNATGDDLPGGSGLPAIIPTGFAPQTNGPPAIAGQATRYADVGDKWRPGPSARLAAAQAYCANEKRMVRRLPAGARRALSA